MGLTDPWLVTTEGQRNWTAACEREIEARFNWNEKWGWMPKIMAEPIEKLKELKERQIARIQEKGASSKRGFIKDPKPLPNSVNHEYGWLATKPQYQIERFGPFPLTMKVRVDPTLTEIDDKVEAQDLDRAKRAVENKKRAKIAKKMAERTGNDDDKKDFPQQLDDLDYSVCSDKEERKPEAVAPASALTKHDEITGISSEKPKIEHYDPQHIKQYGKKLKVCCCTSNCPCLKKVHHPRKSHH